MNVKAEKLFMWHIQNNAIVAILLNCLGWSQSQNTMHNRSQGLICDLKAKTRAQSICTNQFQILSSKLALMKC